MSYPPVVSRPEWLAARKKLLAQEKQLTRARDKVNSDRRRLPMVKVDKEYVFDGPNGKATLLALFEQRRQLIVYHMMLTHCPGCSLLIDNIGHLAHLHARDTTLVVVSRSPFAELDDFRRRMGWTMPFYSSHGSDFNYDFHTTVDSSVAPVEINFANEEELRAAGIDYEGEVAGASVFLRDGEDIFHTYSTYERGTDLLNGTLVYLDLTPLGRQEDWEEPTGRSNASASGWWQLHDEYAPGDSAWGMPKPAN